MQYLLSEKMMNHWLKESDMPTVSYKDMKYDKNEISNVLVNYASLYWDDYIIKENKIYTEEQAKIIH